MLKKIQLPLAKQFKAVQAHFRIQQESVSNRQVDQSVKNSIKKYRKTYLQLEHADGPDKTAKTQSDAKNLARSSVVQKYLRELSRSA